MSRDIPGAKLLTFGHLSLILASDGGKKITKAMPGSHQKPRDLPSTGRKKRFLCLLRATNQARRPAGYDFPTMAAEKGKEGSMMSNWRPFAEVAIRCLETRVGSRSDAINRLMAAFEDTASHGNACFGLVPEEDLVDSRARIRELEQELATARKELHSQ